MTADELRTTILEVLGTIAPEVEASDIDLDDDIQEQLDIDSIDFLNFVTGLHEKTGIEVPERDYPKVGTVNECVSYLAAKSA